MSDTSKYPPMLVQYLEYKAQYPEHLILFQVGDFYEIFFDDAVTVARSLNLTLTSRDKQSPEPIPMCGVPRGVIDGYLERLVEQGFSVGLVSQQGDASQTKGMVPRFLDRIVTPGIRLMAQGEAKALEVSLGALFLESEGKGACSFTSLESGEVWVREGLSLEELIGEIKRVSPQELVLYHLIDGKPLDRRSTWVRLLEHGIPGGIRWRKESYLEPGTFEELDGMRTLAPLGKKAVRLLLHYVNESSLNVHDSIHRISLREERGTMLIDSMTRENLELLPAFGQPKGEGTLFSFLNRTKTVGGARLLASWVRAPSTQRETIEERLDAVSWMKAHREVRTALSDLLRVHPDTERIAARISVKGVNPRELGALREVLSTLPSIVNLLQKEAPSYLRRIQEELQSDGTVLSLLERFLVDSPPIGLEEGGIVREGYDASLDTLRTLAHSGRGWIAELETQEKARTGIGSLKIKFNNVLGYFIEVSSAAAAKVPSEYVRRQSTANTERFILPKLKEMEEEVLGAHGKQVQKERQLFLQFREELIPFIPFIRTISAALSRLDVIVGLTEVANRSGYVRPLLREDTTLLIEKGRHPVLDDMLGAQYIPNSLSMEEEKKRFVLITGPNMGGKSTFLRQTALITIMAQLGSFVPAERAEIGIADKIFARIGASDNLLEGESTFLVEMREASAILAQATKNSLVLIDELGRGTSTSDGVSLAHSILEWIIQRRDARTLFATHYHELTELEGQFKEKLVNLSVKAVEQGGSLLFTHEIVHGPANRSYGIEVAKLAGLPGEVIRRAVTFLDKYSFDSPSSVQPVQQLSLFGDSALHNKVHKLEEELSSSKEALASFVDEVCSVDCNRMTPLDALQYLFTLQNKLSLTHRPLRKVGNG